MPDKQLKVIGWGYEGEEISEEEQQMIDSRFRERFGGEFEIRKAPTEDAISLHKSRLDIPSSLADFATTNKRDRLVHTYGKSLPDYARAFEGDVKSQHAHAFAGKARRRRAF